VLPKGTTFIRDRHIWFNLTEPTRGNSFVLCVNLTTMDEECADDECRLSHSDYRWVELDHPTVVAFSRARVWDARKIVLALKSGLLRRPVEGDIPKAALAKVIRSATTSRELSPDFKALL
jgi:hypothetical protein